MKKEKNVVLIAIVVITTTMLMFLTVNTASADSGNDLPKDYYDNTLKTGGGPPESIMVYDGFKAVNKPLDEPIMTPDDVLDKILKEKYEKNGETEIGVVKISPTDLAVWMAVESEKTGRIERDLVYLDTDGDGKPEELAAQFYPMAFDYPDRNTKDFVKPIEDHFKKTTGDYYLINPFEEPKESLGNFYDYVYIEDPDKSTILMHEEERKDDRGRKLDNVTVPDEIPWYEAVGKTPRELGLDKYDRQNNKPDSISSEDGIIMQDTKLPDERQGDDSKTDDGTDTPGFRGIATLGAVGMVAYLATKYRKNK
jgi:hypothetical protein